MGEIKITTGVNYWLKERDTFLILKSSYQSTGFLKSRGFSEATVKQSLLLAAEKLRRLKVKLKSLVP